MDNINQTNYNPFEQNEWLMIDEPTTQEETIDCEKLTTREIKSQIQKINVMQRGSRNTIRGARIYNVILKAIIDFILKGDDNYQINNVMQYHPPFKMKRNRTKANKDTKVISRLELTELIEKETVIDINVIDFVRFASTCFGGIYQNEAKKIVEKMNKDELKLYPLRFRCAHTLFKYGDSKYQNICLVSAMIHLGIPIPGYFDGTNILV